MPTDLLHLNAVESLKAERPGNDTHGVTKQFEGEKLMWREIGNKNKSWFAKSLIGITLVLLGIVIGVVAVVAFIILN